MNPAYESWLIRSAAQISGGSIVSFGDSSAELAAAEAESVIVPLVHLGLIRVSGEDAAPFLHNLLSNDVKGMTTDTARLNSFCTAKGRMLASLIMWREAGDYFLHLSADIAAGIHKKLSMFVLRSKAKLCDASAERCQFGLAGAKAADALRAAGYTVPEAVLGVTHGTDGTLVRLDASRLMLSAVAEGAAETFATLRAHGLVPAGTAAWQWLDIRAGWPLITGATQEEFVPQMANFELIGGVSFNKGCYPGQEIVARTQYLGKLKKRMYRAFVATDATPAAGADLYSPDVGEQSCGKVVSASPVPDGGFELLAVLQMSSHGANNVHLGAPGGPRLEFRPLPYTVS